MQELGTSFDSYKRHHSSPLLIIEQLLMNLQIDLCAKTVKMCRESIGDLELHEKINQTLVNYAKKALEFKVYSNVSTVNNNETTGQIEQTKSRSPQAVGQLFPSKINKQRRIGTPIDIASSLTTGVTASPNNLNLSSSLKSLYKLNPQAPFNTMNVTNSSSTAPFIMPAQAPSKEEWIKDESTSQCMVCKTRRFTLLNRRHHCRRSTLELNFELFIIF